MASVVVDRSTLGRSDDYSPPPLTSAHQSSGVVVSHEVSIKKAGTHRVQRTVKEVYLRPDVPCGIRTCRKCAQRLQQKTADPLITQIGLPLDLLYRHAPQTTTTSSDRRVVTGCTAGAAPTVSPKLADQGTVTSKSTENGVCTGGDKLLDKQFLEEWRPLLVPDVDVLCSQIDFLAEDPSVENCMVLGSLLAEARRRDRRTAFKLGAMFDASIARLDNPTEDDDQPSQETPTGNGVRVKQYSCASGGAHSSSAIVIDDDDDDGHNNTAGMTGTDDTTGAGTTGAGTTGAVMDKRVFIFRDEFNKETYTQRMTGETAEERVLRSTISTVRWLIQHINDNCTVPVQMSKSCHPTVQTSNGGSQVSTGMTWAQRFQNNSDNARTCSVVDVESNDGTSDGVSDDDDQVCTATGTGAGTDMITVQLPADGNQCVLLLVGTKKRKAVATKAGIPVMLITEFVEVMRRHRFPSSGELLSEFIDDDVCTGAEHLPVSNGTDITTDDERPPAKRAKTLSKAAALLDAPRRRPPIYPPHLKESQILAGIKTKRLLQGTLRMPPSTSILGFVKCPNPVKTGGAAEVLEYRVGGRLHLNRAFHGDVVVIEPLASPPRSTADTEEEGLLTGEEFNDVPTAQDGKLEAKVVGIVRRNWREFAGTLRPLDEAETRGASTFVKIERTFIPVDPKVPFIVIKTRQSSELEGKRLFVAVDGWSRQSRLPLGHWTRIIGTYGDVNTENELILRENGVITRDFSESALRCLPPVTWRIPQAELQRRLDLRDQFVCSVDPPGCKDIDDALSIKQLDDQHFEVGVHIADVTYFLRPDSSLDLEAATRSTTVYLVDRRTDMLPGLLTTQLCSLVAEEDRLAFSVFMKVSMDGQVVSSDFAKTVIRSRAAYTYAEAQLLIDDDSQKVSEAARNLRNLYKLSQSIRERRTASGALSLASEEATFTLDSETHDLTDVSVYELRGTNRMIEDYMCLANTTVAQFILKKYPNSAVLRRHPGPKMEDLEQLKKLLAAKGYPNFNFGTSKQLATSLDAMVSSKDPYFNKLIRILTTRCMNAASYFCTGDLPIVDYPHYGLGLQRYTHFTSPIRRYADVLAHRLLAASLGIDTLPEQLVQKQRIVDQCQVMNEKTYSATIASRDAVQFTSYLFFKSKGEQTANAVVTTVRENGVLLQIPQYAIQSLVKVKSTDYDFHADSQKLVAKHDVSESGDSMVKKLPTVQIFDKLRVRIYAEAKLFRNKLVVEILEKLPPFAPV